MKKILYKNEWFLQHRVNQLGNFVMSTPLLISLSEIYQRPIPVYFETDIIKTLYINAVPDATGAKDGSTDLSPT